MCEQNSPCNCGYTDAAIVLKDRLDAGRAKRGDICVIPPLSAKNKSTSTELPAHIQHKRRLCPAEPIIGG